MLERQSELPIQPVDKPIICKPYDEPRDTGSTTARDTVEGRWPAARGLLLQDGANGLAAT